MKQTNFLSAIYKKDSKGKIRIFEIEAFSDGTIEQRSGLLDGKPTVNKRVCHPKNLGRSNETTASEQAIIEAMAIITKKLKEGYFKTIKEANDTKVLMPMLAQKASIEFDSFNYPIYVQPKLDGIRCLTYDNKMWTRKAREIDTMDHLDVPNGLDGELYNHEKTFQEITSLVKKKQPESISIDYWVYDCHDCVGTFRERIKTLSKLKDTYDYPFSFHLVPTYKVNTADELIKLHEEFVSTGFEGTIIRTDDTQYEYNKRSKSLLKLKDFVDEEFKIINVIPSSRRPDEGVIVCEMADGNVFNCGMKVSVEERKRLLKDKHNVIGNWAKVRYFEKTDGGIPRFPVFVGIRWENDMS